MSFIVLISLILTIQFVNASSPKKVPSQTTVRCKINGSTSVQLTINRNDVTDAVTVTAQYVSFQTGDLAQTYLMNGAGFNSSHQVTTPSTGTFWRIVFDFNNETPPATIIGGSSPVCFECSECIAAAEGSVGCTPVLDGSCVKCDHDCGCMLSRVDCPTGEYRGGPGVILEAASLTYNNQQY